jgi:hypothetical protein
MGKHRWRGELAKPIRPKVIRPRGLLVTKKRAQAANLEMEHLYQRAIEEEYLRKLELLMEEYEIADKTDFRSLALALALELRIPGFRIDPTPLRLEQIDDQGIQLVVQDNWKGPQPKWSLGRLRKLLSTVEDMIKRDNITAPEALSRLAGRGEWPRLKTLKNRLAEARRLFKQSRPSRN